VIPHLTDRLIAEGRAGLRDACGLGWYPEGIKCNSMRHTMYAFIHIPKTAGSTLRHLLRCAFGAQHCDVKIPTHRRAVRNWVGARDIALARKVYPDLCGIAGHRVISFEGLADAVEELRFFTVLREPIGRSISHFGYIHRHLNESLTREHLVAFLEQPVNRDLQTKWLSGKDDAGSAIREIDERIGFVGLMERFDETLLLLQHWLKEPAFNVHHVPRNQATRELALPFRSDPELLAMLTEANREDLEVYDYVTSSLFPASVAAYPGDLAADLAIFQQENESFSEVPEPRAAQLRRNLVYKPLRRLRGV